MFLKHKRYICRKQQSTALMPILPKIFIAYAHEDKQLLQKLRTHLNVMRRQQHCEIFFDGEIMPGETWDRRLKDELHAAHIFVLLVTAEFLDSEYVNETELPKILERMKAGEAEVVAVILKDCLWELTELQHLQVVLHEGNPIEERNGYAFAAREVFKLIENRNKKIISNDTIKDYQKTTLDEILSPKNAQYEVTSGLKIISEKYSSRVIRIVKGFGGRVYQTPRPPINTSDNFGTISIFVCVDKNGLVVTAEFTHKGSTSTNTDLKNLAIDNAKKYKFQEGGPDMQCGLIRFTFESNLITMPPL